MALPGFEEPSGYEPTNRHKLEQESFAPKHSSDQPPSTPDSASGESNLAARRQKMMEQQRLQLQLKKKNSLNSGILRLDSGSPMRPSSASNSPNNFRSLDPNSPSSASGVPLTYGGTSSRPASPQTGLFGSLRPASPGLSSAAGYSLDNQQQPTGNNSNPNGTSAFSYAPPSLESYSSTDYTQKDPANTNSTASPNVSALEKEMMAQGIQPIFEPNVAPPKLEAKIDLTDLRSFLNTPPARDVVIQCHIVRQKSGLMNKLYPTYELYTKDDQFLMASKKRTKNKTSNYLISTDRNDMEKTSSSFVGKVRSNFVGTEFVFYDKGLSPKEFADKVLNNVSILTVRQELGYVQYESNVLGSRGPRKMTVGIPRVNRDGTRETFRPIKEEDSIVARAKRMESDNMMTLHNKFPRWNDQFEAYVLNFNGRVTMASVKNFQLIFDEDPENVILQFGRVAKDKFTMDFKWPLTPLQAFSICLSSFDYKLACE